MAYETIVVAFYSGARASLAVQEIRRMGVPRSDIRRHPVDAAGIEEVAELPATTEGAGFWAWLFGEEPVDARVRLYEQALQGGGTVLSVRVLEEEAARVRAALEQFGPLDLRETP